MDFHILIVIACVFLASLLSLIFINKIFRRKTFEEVIAEKKALTANLYAQSKAAAGAHKKPSKKKELKREKKQRQREQQRDAVATATEQEDSDGQSEQASVEDDDAQPGLSKTHVEFEPDPEVLTYNANAAHITEEKRRASNAEKQTQAPKNNKRDKKNGVKATSGILVNKHEPVAVKQQMSGVEELNSFDVKPPKDVVELRRQEKKDEKNNNSNNNSKGKDKNAKKERQTEKAPLAEQTISIVTATVVDLPHREVAKQQQQEEKVRQGSPKTQQNANNNKSKQQQKKQQQHKENSHASAKDLVLGLDKLSENETVGVSLFMNLFRRSELNRSEIQILIDYLLNKQQDMPSTHSEWSDDICLKLKRQLEEKEKALTEEQEASIGIQAKLRELRNEINTERAIMNVTVKAYMEKLQSKEQEITGLNQELQQQNDKFAVERQQFQAKILGEKQQLQLMQNDLAHKDKCIAELTQFMNASRQAVEESQRTHEIIQNQVQQIHTLEQQRDELEALQNNNIFELEKLKTIETENAEIKVEIRNLQNALESSKVDAAQASKEIESYKNDAMLRNNELTEKENMIGVLQATNDQLTEEMNMLLMEQQRKEQTELQNGLDALQQQLSAKEQQLLDANAKHVALEAEFKQTLQTTQQQSTQQQQELLKLVDTLKEDVAGKQTQLAEAQKAKEQAGVKEKELLQQLSEQREKNNDLRMKNWKLIEALQNAEATTTTTATTTQKQKQNTKQTLTKANTNLVQQEKLLAAAQQQQQEQTAARNGSAALIETATTGTVSASSGRDEKQLRELFQRLYPEAVKSCSGSALSASFDQWVEQVLATLVKQALSKANANSSSSTSISSSNKSTQSNNNNNNNNNNTSNNSSNHDAHNNINSNSSSNSNSGDSSSGKADDADAATAAAAAAAQQELQSQNMKLRGRIDELTQLVTKTSNTVLDLENRAREQEANWTSIVRQKDEVIHTLQHSNGEQDI